jgi:hypothetical protein
MKQVLGGEKLVQELCYFVFVSYLCNRSTINNNLMKKLVFTLGFMLVLFAGKSFAQAPVCSNQNGLEGRIDAIEAQGWQEVSRQFIFVNYLIAPEAPYLIGTLEVAFAPDCPEGQACPQIVRLYTESAIAQQNGNCIWKKD